MERTCRPRFFDPPLKVSHAGWTIRVAIEERVVHRLFLLCDEGGAGHEKVAIA